MNYQLPNFAAFDEYTIKNKRSYRIGNPVEQILWY